jgi:hypothetical protein
MYLTPKTVRLLCFEIENMLKHYDTTNKQAEELQELLYALSEFDEVRIFLS